MGACGTTGAANPTTLDSTSTDSSEVLVQSKKKVVRKTWNSLRKKCCRVRATASNSSEDSIHRSQFIRSNSGKLKNVYDVQQKLGEGTYGSVSRGVHKVTGAVRAIKFISKPNVRDIPKLYREISIMKVMDHPNIIKLFETFEDSRKIYLAMELCQGGELFDRIIAQGRFTENEAAMVMQSILRAVCYMHEHYVCHRDLKPENFLFVNKGPIASNTLKLIDFGFAKRFEPGKGLTTKAGTPYYIAPQVLSCRYDHLCDMWSAGAIMFTLLSGRPAFPGRTDQEVLSKVRKGKYDFHSREWQHISTDAKHLINKMLRIEASDRITADQALQDEWIRLHAPHARKKPFDSTFVGRLRNYSKQNRLKRAAYQIIVGQLNDQRVKDLREKFLALDKDGNGSVTVDELREGFISQQPSLKVTEDDVDTIMAGVDDDHNGVIEFTEFLAAGFDKRSILGEEALKTAFNLLDRDGDGLISAEDVSQVLDNGQFTTESEEIVAEADKNGDGGIDFSEFRLMMGKSLSNASSGGLSNLSGPVLRRLGSASSTNSSLVKADSRRRKTWSGHRECGGAMEE